MNIFPSKKMNTSRLNQPVLDLILFFVAGVISIFIGLLLPLRMANPLRHDFLFPFIVVFAISWIIWCLPNPWRKLISFCFTVILFVATLSSLWRMGNHEVYQVFGLQPWFDSQGYYSDAVQLLNGHSFTHLSARRPLFSGFFAVLLFITARNLRVALLILTVIAGISTWYLAKEVNETEKSSFLPATIITLLFFFFRRFTGSVLTETLAFPLGIWGLIYLWRSAITTNFRIAIIGLFIFTFALSVRPGAVLTIPMIILWICFYFKTNRSIFYRFIIASFSVVLVLMLNSGMTSILAANTNQSYENFSYTFYGIVNGGKGWNAIFQDHPEIRSIKNPGEQSNRIYKYSFAILQKNPEKIFLAYAKSIQIFFSAGYYSAFNFLGSSSTPHLINFLNAPVEFSIRWLICILYLSSFLLAIVLGKSPRIVLLQMLNIGVLISLFFVPPSDAENSRVFCVSLPEMILSIGIVPVALLRKGHLTEPVITNYAISEYWFSGVLLFLVILCPILLRISPNDPNIQKKSCPEGMGLFLTRISPGSTTSIGNQPQDPFSIPYARFSKEIDHFPDASVANDLRRIPVKSIISQQNDEANPGEYYWLIGSTDIISPTNKVVSYCGHFVKGPSGPTYFFVEEIAK